MPSARAIVCEETTKWAIALRRASHGAPLRILETRSLQTCWQEVLTNPASFVMLECLPVNLERTVRWIQQFGTRFRNARVAVLCDPKIESSQWLLREVGAVHTVLSPRNLEPLIGILRRHLDSIPVVEDSLRHQIWQRLPWKGNDYNDPERNSS